MAYVVTDPLIRWAGSKRKMISAILPFIGDLGHAKYIEPFAGSACILFALNPRAAVINDLNGDLIRMYRQVRRAPEDIYKRALALEQESDYYGVRALQPNSLLAADQAARFLYLNRYCFNGIYRTNLKGQFNVPIGTKTGELPTLQRFLDAAKILRRCKLLNGDFRETITHIKKNDFVFIDPPYATRTRKDRNEYGCGSFALEDLPRLRQYTNSVNRLGARFLLTYENTNEIRELYSDSQISALTVQRNMQGFKNARRTASEVLISNF